MLLSSLIFLLSGLLSAYTYCRYYHYGGVFMPGFIYTSATILVFVIYRVPLRLKDGLVYFSLMNLIYLSIWLLTMVSSFFALFGGIITAGLGAHLTFFRTEIIVRNFQFSRLAVFIAGAISFGIVDIISLSSEITLTDYLFNHHWSGDILFADIFIFWQLITGIMLAIHLRKSQISENMAIESDAVEH